MQELMFEKTVLGHALTVRLSPVGRDVLVEIRGGCAPHIGSVSVGRWEQGEVFLETVLLPGHRDDVVGDLFAGRLAQTLKTTVTAVCGIHYDQPGKEGIEQIVSAARELLETVCGAVSS